MANPISPATRVGIIHLFATGERIADNTLIQISVTAFSTESNPEEQTWVFNPNRRITKRLFQKTGLSNQHCQSSASWSQAKKGVWEFLDKVEILFYLDTESRKQWLENVVLAGKTDPPALVDLATMAHFFLPGKQRAYTDVVVAKLGAKLRQPVVSRSQGALTGMSVLLSEILNVVYQGIGNGTSGIPPLIYFFAYFVFGSPVTEDSAGLAFFRFIRVALGAHKIRWTSNQLLLDFPPLAELPQQPDVLAHDVRLVFSPDFQEGLPSDPDDDTGYEAPKRIDPNYVQEMLRRTIDSSSWTFRRSQQEYVSRCSKAIANGGVYALEAGTGTGKTLGYLLPASQFAIVNPKCQVFIASSTKNLAEQLSNHEWQKMPSQIRAQLTTALLLGKRNYLCRYAVVSFVVGQKFGELTIDERLAWVYMCMVLNGNQGIIEGIPRQITRLIPSILRLRQEMNADAACTRDSCKHYATCTYATRLGIARKANIVFTNHHKLALQLSVQDFERVAVMIVDEADQFAENVRKALRLTVSRDEVDDFTWIMTGSGKRRGFMDLLEGEFEQHGADEATFDSIKQVREDCHEVRRRAARIGELYARNAKRGEMRWHEMKRPDLEELYDELNAIGRLFDRIEGQLEFVRESDRYKDVRHAIRQASKELEKEFRRLASYKEKAQRWASSMKQLVHNHQAKHREFIHTVSTDALRPTFRSQSGSRWTLSQYTFDIGSQITEILKHRHASIFTSATLFVDGSLNLFELDLLGESADDVTLVRPPSIASEFDHAKQILGGILDVIDEPYDSSWPMNKKRRWDQATACMVAALCVAMYGRTLVLFTSVKDMQQYFDWLEPVLARLDVELLLQDGPSYEESELFRASEHSVLFGVNRFWSGVINVNID